MCIAPLFCKEVRTSPKIVMSAPEVCNTGQHSVSSGMLFVVSSRYACPVWQRFSGNGDGETQP